MGWLNVPLIPVQVAPVADYQINTFALEASCANKSFGFVDASGVSETKYRAYHVRISH